VGLILGGASVVKRGGADTGCVRARPALRWRFEKRRGITFCGVFVCLGHEGGRKSDMPYSVQ